MSDFREYQFTKKDGQTFYEMVDMTDRPVLQIGRFKAMHEAISAKPVPIEDNKPKPPILAK